MLQEDRHFHPHGHQQDQLHGLGPAVDHSQEFVVYTAVFITKCFFAETGCPLDSLRLCCEKIAFSSNYSSKHVICKTYAEGGFLYHTHISFGVCSILVHNLPLTVTPSHHVLRRPEMDPTTLQSSSQSQIAPPSLLQPQTHSSIPSPPLLELAFNYLGEVNRAFQEKYKEIPNPQRDFQHFMEDLQEDHFQQILLTAREERRVRQKKLSKMERTEFQIQEAKNILQQNFETFEELNQREQQHQQEFLIEATSKKPKKSFLMKFVFSKKNLKLKIWLFFLIVLIIVLVVVLFVEKKI
eukprot:TRINITY_DN6114_c0_g2_i1.p1 TRINITY_DN6114_c0_g2~~TRINITY_DN6114_c0_g2_i1.p1  ORF type:complete len:296 (-),score=59.30 TRINITY_DN6114_c0_g2_i1:314-1201(-)